MEENVVKKGKINETVEELLIGILFSGAVFQASFVWLAKDKVSYSIGLWIGVLTAAFLAWHIWKSLDAALVQEEGTAQKLMRTKALLRYGLVIGVLGVLMCTRAANPLAAFLGIMTLKAGAYLQPLTHKIKLKLRR